MNIEQIKEYIKNEGLDLKSKKRSLAYRRAYLYKYIRTEIGFSYESIGKLFNRDHATVMHGEKLYNRFRTDPVFIGHVIKELGDFPITEEPINLPNKNLVLMRFDKEMYLKVQLYRINNQIPTNEEAIKRIIETA